MTAASCASVSTPSAVVVMPQRLAERRDRAHDLLGVALVEILHEGLVDLDLVEGEAAQIAQRGIAGAEIVHRDPDAHAAQRMQDFQRALVLAQQDRFGDLEFEPPAAIPAASRAATTVSTRFGVLNWAAERLTVTLTSAGHLRGLAAGRLEHPFAERNDQAGLLGERDEFGRRDRCRDRMAPAHQRFEAAIARVARVEQRLVVDLELLFAQRLAQVDLEPAARLQLRVHRRFEEAKGPRPSALAR